MVGKDAHGQEIILAVIPLKFADPSDIALLFGGSVLPGLNTVTSVAGGGNQYGTQGYGNGYNQYPAQGYTNRLGPQPGTPGHRQFDTNNNNQTPGYSGYGGYQGANGLYNQYPSYQSPYNYGP